MGRWTDYFSCWASKPITSSPTSLHNIMLQLCAIPNHENVHHPMCIQLSSYAVDIVTMSDIAWGMASPQRSRGWSEGGGKNWPPNVLGYVAGLHRVSTVTMAASREYKETGSAWCRTAFVVGLQKTATWITHTGCMRWGFKVRGRYSGISCAYDSSIFYLNENSSPLAKYQFGNYIILELFIMI